ncbi:Hypothetical predicted protein [Podarcis lilfordi]|uniref:Uncharacterized protein n=1 Tax=Podarcis lilfordi TaxID=74358 RepID=A0AA35P267_9SAUR|nr:Hypothetical predicted protein [Podarcis lilfordi]
MAWRSQSLPERVRRRRGETLRRRRRLLPGAERCPPAGPGPSALGGQERQLNAGRVRETNCSKIPRTDAVLCLIFRSWQKHLRLNYFFKLKDAFTCVSTHLP